MFYYSEIFTKNALFNNYSEILNSYFSIGFGIRELINAYKMIIKHNDRNFTNLWVRTKKESGYPH